MEKTKKSKIKGLILFDDMKIEEVVYGDKYKMIVNFDNQKRTANGREFRPYQYKLEG